MPKTQQTPVNPPVISDREALLDYSGAIQRNLNDLFQSAHDHLILTSNPGKTSGKPQTISIVDTGSSVYLVVKTTRGWFKSAAFTAI